MPLLFLLPMLKHFINNKYTASRVSAKDTRRTSVLFETNKGSASLDSGWGIQSFLKSSITFRFMLRSWLGLSPSHFATGACREDALGTDNWVGRTDGEILRLERSGRVRLKCFLRISANGNANVLLQVLCQSKMVCFQVEINLGIV